VVTENVGCSMLTKKMGRGEEIMTLDIKQNKKKGGVKLSL